MKRWILLLSLMVVISACSPDPRKEAQAYQIREQADQDALNQQQNRAHAEKLHAFRLEQLEVEQGHREATATEWRNGMNTMIRYGFIVSTFSVCAIILMFGIGGARGVYVATSGIGKAVARLAEVRANLIYLDRATRQYPLHLQYVGNGKYSMTDPNDGSTLMLDTRNEADRQKIQGAMNARYAGTLAEKAQKANDAASVAIIQAPTILEGKDIVDLVRLDSYE